MDDEIIFVAAILLGYEMPHDVVHRYPKPEKDTAAYYGNAHCARYASDYNIDEPCARCRMCQKSCPPGAIPVEETKYKGATKRSTDHIKCFDMMAIALKEVKMINLKIFGDVSYEGDYRFEIQPV